MFLTCWFHVRFHQFHVPLVTPYALGRAGNPEKLELVEPKLEPTEYPASGRGRRRTSAGGWVALQTPPTPRLSAVVGKAVRRVPAEGRAA
jgi:hypothetical protein